MCVYFGLLKDGEYVFHQSTNKELWNDFIKDRTTNIPDVVIADVNDFFKYFHKGITIADCSECHFWDFELGIEKICYDLSKEVLEWETKSLK